MTASTASTASTAPTASTASMAPTAGATVHAPAHAPVSRSPVPGAWRKAKKTTRQPSQREQARYASHIAQLKEKFAEVDAFELIAETPSPQGQQGRGRDGHAAGRSMLSHDKRERSAAKGERSGSMLERMSHGLQDALGWLNKSVLKSGGAGKKNRVGTEGFEARVGVALDFGGTTDANQEIFTIGEGSDEEREARGELKEREEWKEDRKPAHGSAGNAAAVEKIGDAINNLHIDADADADVDVNVSVDVNASSLGRLLRLCNQDENPSKIPSMDALLKRLLSSSSTESATASKKRTTFDAKKVGEGTFGEAFKTTSTASTASGPRRQREVVFKIVPIETLPTQKTAAEICSETEVSLKLTKLREAVDPAQKSITSISNITSGFVETYAVGVCRGAYSQQLVAEWNRWNELHRSENEPVDAYGASQLYAVFVQANGGADLETFKPRNFDEVKSILLQVALALAVAENACQFEHRDLHWGNVLVRRSDSSDRGGRLECTMNDVDISVETSGVNVTLIDFTLSRLNGGGGGGGMSSSAEPLASSAGSAASAASASSASVVYCDLSVDPEIFNGPEGDLQADAYRRMQAEIDNASGSSPGSTKWARYLPRTNAIWIEYLAGIMLHYKGKWKKAEKDALLGFMERARDEGESAESLVWDSLFAGCWE